jgi:hypothetical protein
MGYLRIGCPRKYLDRKKWYKDKKLNNKEHKLYPLRNIVRFIKSKKMRWAEYVACTETMTNSSNILFQTPEMKRQICRSRLIKRYLK